MLGVILAAGRGTRLHPITAQRSKAMLPILGKPIVERVMDTMAQAGVREFILVVNPADTEIVDHFRRRPGLWPDVRFVRQSENLGMANALLQAAPFIHDDFLLSACDNLVAGEHVAELVAAHGRDTRLQATLSLMRIDESLLGRTGIVDLDERGWVTRILEKPALQDAPTNIASLALYAFRPTLLQCLPLVKPSARGEYELQDAIQMLIESHGGVRGVFVPDRLTLTNAEDLRAINRHFFLREPTASYVAPSAIGRDIRLRQPLRIEDGVAIGEGCSIGPHVYLESGCHVGVGAVLRDAVVLRGAEVPPRAEVIEEVVSPSPVQGPSRRRCAARNFPAPGSYS